ncbi:MAG: Asp-tRNA(Asn)/Glu-tRNA(Gln) amidotransferase subunit GatC [Candidatus Krumholzibacteriia bacterium]
MANDESVVRGLERLAALRLGDHERVRFAARLARVVAYVEQLRELDTAVAWPEGWTEEGTAARRADTPSPSLPVAEALAPAPDAARGLFVVPPAFGEDGADG